MLTFAVLVLLGADPSAPPPPPPLVDVPQDPVRIENPQRNATLLDDQPSQPADLVGRAILAPVLGAVGGGLSFGVGLLVGVAGAGSNVLGALLGFVVGGALALVAVPAGVALGASLFSTRFGELFWRTVPWALLGVAVGGVVFLAAVLLLPTVGLIVGPVLALAACAAVPLVVEARRLAVAADERDRSGVPVAAF